MRIDVAGTIGHALWSLGVYDLVMSEALWRLCDEGEHAADIGANVGYATSLLARRVGPAGRVTCLEPHPKVWADLMENVSSWNDRSRFAEIRVVQAACAARAGSGWLEEPADFGANPGTARLTQDDVGAIGVALTTLESEVGDDVPQVVKIDTEGNELEVLQGAGPLIGPEGIRDIVYEDHDAQPSQRASFLLERGYTVFALKKTLLGPRLASLTSTNKSPWEPANYLATIDPVRAEKRLARPGWRALRHSVR